MPRKTRDMFASPMDFSVTVSGMQQLDRALREFTPVLQKKIQRRVTRVVAKHMREKIRAVTPVDTGRMKQHYMVRAAQLRLSASAMGRARSSRRKRRKNVVGSRVLTGTRAKLGINPKDKYYYPAIVEFGAPRRNIRPNPVMRRTLKNQKHMARYLFHTLMKAEVAKTARELRAGTITPRGVKVKKK